MTYPIIPNPGIVHKTNEGSYLKGISFLSQPQLETFGKLLIAAMTKDVINAVLAALGSKENTPPPNNTESEADQIILDLYNAFSGFVNDVVDAVHWVEQLGAHINQAWLNLHIGNVSVKQLLADINTAVTTFEQDITSPTGWGQMLADFDNAWSSFLQTVHNLETGAYTDISTFLSHVLGFDRQTGQLPAANVIGIQGAPDIGSTVQSILDSIVNVVEGNESVGNAVSSAIQALQSLNTTATTASSSANAALSTLNIKPLSAGLESTVESNGNYTAATTSSNNVALQTKSLGGFLRVSQAKTFGFVQWMGYYPSTAPANLYINVYQLTGGNLVLLFTQDVTAEMTSTPEWVVVSFTENDLANLPNNEFSVQPGDVLAFELQVIDSADNTYEPAMITPATSVGPHPLASVQYLGFSQNWDGAAASTIAESDIGWSQSAPYFGFGVGTPQTAAIHSPVTTSYTTPGTYTWEPPSWFVFGTDETDIVCLGSGAPGGVSSGAAVGGAAGSWAAQTITPTAAFTVTVPAGGVTDNGAPGAGAEATAGPVAAAGGSGFTDLTSGDGESPGNYTFNGVTYYGGGVQAQSGAAGVAPGGGGGAPNTFWPAVIANSGGAGAPGAVWVVARQAGT